MAQSVVLAALISTLAGGIAPAAAYGVDPAAPSPATATAAQRLAPEPLPPAAIACWGWYEGPQGRDGQHPCPADVAGATGNA